MISLLLLVIYCKCNEYFFNINNYQSNDINYNVVHLRSATERYPNILKNQKKIKKKINIFDGILGKTVDLNNLKIFDNKLTFNFKYRYINEIGCYLSHFMLIRSINKTTGYTVIFEDDFVILIDDLDSKVKQIINNINNIGVDFDIIYLANLRQNHGKNLTNDIYYVDKNQDLFGMYGLLINNKSAKKIYEKLLNMDESIDRKLKNLIDNNELKAFTIYPVLVDPGGHNFNSLIR